MAHVEAERWALAAEAFRQTYELGREYNVPQAPIGLWNMGLALMRIPGREAEAIDIFRRFLDESTTLTDDAEIRDWRSTAVEHIAELEARIGSGEASTEEGREEDAGEHVDETAADAQPVPSGGGGISPIGPIVLGAGILGLGIGAVLGALALVDDGALNTRCGGTACPDTAENHGTYSEMWSLAAASDVALIVGGLAAVTGLVLSIVLRETQAEPNTVQARLVVRPGQLASE
ncbi:MAG: hypothetical protein M5U28_03175 [Sandaracinaceae bacterium]|nr:hypothetical protein [Sandaracinaceae bacterium]